MAKIPHELKYTKTHEWAELDEDEYVTVGITYHAQHMLGDIVFIELPEVGTQLRAGEEFGVVESVKAASDLYCPITGEIVAVNDELSSNPSLINTDPYQEGWIIKIKPEDVAECDELMDSEEYSESVEAQQKSQ
jgi:glycine cleavage system H protein